MSIGRKISELRTGRGLSQEALAEILGVSRQSVSKWEIEQALPQIDKIIQIAEYFGVTSDEILKPEQNSNITAKKERGKYFGTDGFRGEANIGLTSQQAYKVGRFLGWYYSSEARNGKRARIVIGKDTRRSSYMLEYSIAAGITASGADAYMLHVTTTPSVSYVVRQEEFDAGIMITASHNPYFDNGIKIINRFGEKLDDDTTAKIEAYLDGEFNTPPMRDGDLPLATGDKIGCIIDHVAGRNRYIGYLISLASNSYKKLRIGLDCASGASWNIAPSVFGALGASVYTIGCEPNGVNINEDCGSTHIEHLTALVKREHLDIGFAFDGDADRCIAVDEYGNVVDGDKIIYILAKRLKRRGMLKGDTVVATVMSNSGFVKSLADEGIGVELTKVGDRFVYEKMQESDYSIGGEQSGHIIVRKYATTGDGLLTALLIAEELCDTKMTLSRLAEPVKTYPQYTENVKVSDKDAVAEDKNVLSALSSVEGKIGGLGRVLLRKSGTEPVIRVMVEAESAELCRAYAEEIVRVVKESGYAVE